MLNSAAYRNYAYPHEMVDIMTYLKELKGKGRNENQKMKE